MNITPTTPPLAQSNTVLLWRSPEEMAERELQEQADEYQREAIAEAQAEELTDLINWHWRSA